METLQRILQEETDTVVKQIKPGQVDLSEIEQELMRRMAVRIDQANMVYRANRSSMRVAMPKYLHFGQIADILGAALDLISIKDIDNGPQALLAYDPDTGLYTADLRSVQLAALQLNGTLTKGSLARVIERLIVTQPCVELSYEDYMTALRDGLPDPRQR